MKKLNFLLMAFIPVFLSGCSITFDFDGAMIERFTNKISYLYANCRSDIEGLQEVMTPETIESMDQTCVASIKAITKIKGRIEKLKGKFGDSEVLSELLVNVDELTNSLQKSKDQIKNYSSNVDISGLVNQMNGDKLVENLENLAKEYSNE